MTSLIKKPLFWTNVVAFTITGLVVASVAFGWTNPTGAPPTVGGAITADSSGNVGIGTTASASYKLNVAGKSRGDELCIGPDCRAYWPSAGLDTTGSPILNRVTKFTDIGSPKKIGNSIIFDNGTKVGIGTDAPTEALEVVGKVKSSGSSAGLCIGSNCITGWGPFTASKIPKAVTPTTLGDSSITDSAGKIGVQTASPTRALHVGVVGFRLTNGVLPSSPATGDIAIDSADSNKLKWYDGTTWKTATAAVPNYGVSCSKSVAGSSTGGTVGASCSMTCDVSYAISDVKSLETPSDAITYSGSTTATCSDLGYSGAGTSVSCTGTCVRTAP